MFAVITRFVKRFLILLPGVLVGYFAYTDLFPALNRLLPGELALVATYILAAYLLIPVGIRVYRLFIRPTHLPVYSTTPDGLASDPLNIGIVGTRQQLIDTMKQAGWHQADERTFKNLMRLISGTIFKHPYPNAPFSSLHLFGRKQDVGFQLPVDDDPGHRHHVRFWAAGHTGDPRHLEHIRFWRRFHKPEVSDERMFWVGAASLDAGIGIVRHTAQFTHMIHPDTNAERELIVNHLKRTGLIKRERSVKIGEPYSLTNRVLTGYLHADGKMRIIEL